MKYADRSGNQWEENGFQDRFLKILYESVPGRILVKLLVRPWVSRLGGRLLDSRLSCLLIPGFVRRHHIDTDKYEKQNFDSYNDFFTRKLKDGERPVNRDENCLISPCDGKLTVYPITKTGRLMIKHTSYTVAQLLENRKLAKRFEEGCAMVFRLTVDDYHRYCYMDDGVKSSNYRIPGIFHTVNPIANDLEPIYKKNTREYCLLHTKNFGALLVMEVGALMVGKIHNYHGACSVKRGEEKGRFEFGGSTIVVLTEPGKAAVHRDIMKNSRRGYETLVKMGEAVGTKN